MLYRSVLPVNGSSQNVELLDCSGQDLKPEVEQWAEAFIIVYSITDKCSLSQASHLLKTLSSKRPDAPVLVFGNKGDLEHRRQVTKSEAKAVAQSHEAKFLEVSVAEDCDSMNSAMNTFLSEVIAYRGKSSPSYRKLSPTKLFCSIMNKYSSCQRPTQLIVLEKSEQTRLTARPTPL